MKYKYTSFLVIALFVFAIFANTYMMNVSGAELEEGYDFNWNSELNITLYLPESASPLLSNGLVNTAVLDQMAFEYSQNAMRPVSVEPTERGLAVTLMIYMTTNPDAIRFDDYRNSNIHVGDLHLSATTNDSQQVFDALPDEVAYETDVSRSSVDLAGVQSEFYDNKTDVIAVSNTTIAMTDYNHSLYQFVEFNDYKWIAGSLNATVYAIYGNSTHDTESVVVDSSDYYLSYSDVFFKLPMPSSSNYTLVKSFKVEGLKFSRMRVFSFSADYDPVTTDFLFEGENYVTPLSVPPPYTPYTPSGIFSGFPAGLTNSISKITPQIAKDTVAQAGRGFASIRSAAISAASRATGIPESQIVDHSLNFAKDVVTMPAKVSSSIYEATKDAYEAGVQHAPGIMSEARKHLKAVTVSVGVRAKQFGDSATRAVDMTSQAIKGAMDTAGKAVSAVGTKGKSMFDNVKDTLGRLPDKAASLFSKLDPSKILNFIQSKLKWIIIGVVIVAAVLILPRFMGKN